MSIYDRVPPLPDILNSLMDYEIQLERYHRRLCPLMKKGFETKQMRGDVALVVELIYMAKYMCSRVVMDLCCTEFFSDYFYIIGVKMDRIDIIINLIFGKQIPLAYRDFV